MAIKELYNHVVAAMGFNDDPEPEIKALGPDDVFSIYWIHLIHLRILESPIYTVGRNRLTSCELLPGTWNIRGIYSSKVEERLIQMRIMIAGGPGVWAQIN